MKQLCNEWKVHFTWLYPITTMIFLSFALSLGPKTLVDLYLLFEVLWPLGLVLSISPMLPLEHEEGMLELRLSYSSPFQYSIIKKLALPYCWWVSIGLLIILFCTKGLVFTETWHMAAVAIPPAIALSGLALLVSSLTLDTLTSVIVTLVYWVYEWLNAGAQRKTALFPYYGGISHQINIIANRLFLVAVGLLLSLAALRIITAGQMSSTAE